MPDAPLDSTRADDDRLRARVSELEAELAALRHQVAPAPRLDAPPPAQGPAEHWLRLALDGAGVLAYVVDLPAGRVTASTDLAAFCGAPAGAVSDVREMIHGEDRPAAEAALERLLAEGGDHSFEFRGAWPAADGQPAWFFNWWRLPADQAGRPRRLLGVVTDITARRRAEEERRRLEARTHQCRHLESLAVLAGGIAHEFNNLLTRLIGYTDLARNELPTQSPAHAYLAEVLTAGRRAAELTAQVLAYAGKGRFVLQPVVLSELVRQLWPLLSATVAGKAALEMDVGARVPAVEADLSQMRQIILELVGNGAEAVGDQEGKITVRTGAVDLGGEAAAPDWLASGFSGDVHAEVRPGRYALLEVADTGAGMDAATQARIFEPFFSTRFTGRGLGLAAVQGIVRGHGGHIRVSSAVGGGSCFRVLLPALPEPKDEAAPAGVAAVQGGTVLVVEDDPAVRSLAVLVLTQAGYTVVQAGDGGGGLELFRQRPDGFDAVLLDLTMPGLDGLEVLAELRQVRPAIPVVLMTGYSTRDLARRPGAPAASALLQKPFTPDTLLRTLQRAAGHA